MTSRDSRTNHATPRDDDQAPKILDVPIGLHATGPRRETDSMGAIDVPADRYWGGTDTAVPDPLLHR